MPETPKVSEELDPARRTVLRGAAVVAAASLPLIAVPTTAQAKPKGKPVGAVKDVPVGSGKYFEKAELIVTQPTAGKFNGFNAGCTHTTCPVTNFDTKGKMVCECHGGEFDLDGKAIKAPARRPLNPQPIVVEKGKIYKA